MTSFERTYTDGHPTEIIHRIEKDVVIERLGDDHHLESPIEKLLESFDRDDLEEKEMQSIPKIKIKSIKEKPNEKSKSKAPKKKAKKLPTKLHRPAVESLQEEL